MTNFDAFKTVLMTNLLCRCLGRMTRLASQTRSRRSVASQTRLQRNSCVATALGTRTHGRTGRTDARTHGRTDARTQGRTGDQHGWPVHLVDRSKPIKFNMQIAILRPLLGQIRFKWFGCAHPSSPDPAGNAKGLRTDARTHGRTDARTHVRIRDSGHTVSDSALTCWADSLAEVIKSYGQIHLQRW